MIRHRCRTLLALAAFAAALLPVPARAQNVQVIINTAFVSSARTDAGFGSCTVDTSPPIQFRCPVNSVNNDSSLVGDLSAGPHIQFANRAETRCITANGAQNLVAIQGGYQLKGRHICNDRLFLCTQILTSTALINIDEVVFELFKYQDGSNALDPQSTPPLRTFFIDNPGASSSTNLFMPSQGQAYCVLWDGSYNIQGEFAKTNGQFGFRVSVKTNQISAQTGNIAITAVRAFPSGATLIGADSFADQKPITVDVTDVHVIRSTPSVVGQFTGVASHPYNFSYRLSKDATMFITVKEDSAPNFPIVRRVIPGLPRTGEGTPQGTLLNGDFWDGRDDEGDIMPAGNYLVEFEARSFDQFSAGGATGGDLTPVTTRQLSVDPLVVTDIRLQSLLGGSTSLAVLSYFLTESATVYVDIYPPGTQFCSGLFGLRSMPGPGDGGYTGIGQAKDFNATLGNCPGGAEVQPLRTIAEAKSFRQPVITFWDGRDRTGALVPDGDYVFLIYAALPSRRGIDGTGAVTGLIWTEVAKTGFITVARGLVGITQVTPGSAIIGANPSIAGLSPFTFRYTLSREATVCMKIFKATDTVNAHKTLVDCQTRPGGFAIQETWFDGADNNGQGSPAGTYMVQLQAFDPVFPSKISTTSAFFPLDMYRITDVQTTPLLSGASDNVVLNYQLSEPMFVAWNIYPPGSVVNPNAWPPCAAAATPGQCTSATVINPTTGGNAVPIITPNPGMRPGRLRISEFWDGRDTNGLFVPDGSYVFTLVAQSSTTPKRFAADKVYGTVTVARGAIVFTRFDVLPDSPQLFNSSNTIELSPFTINYALTRQSSVTLQILNTSLPPFVVRTILNGAVRPGGLLQTEVWDGRDDQGNFPPSGFYIVRAIAEDTSAVLSQPSTAQLTIAHDPIRIFDLAITPLSLDDPSAVLSYQLSETMKVSIKIFKPGTIFDPAGNPSPPEAQSLVRRIVGVRPARTRIDDIWDGSDFKFAPVPDGNYRFKIVASTDTRAIDDITGDVLNPAALSLDRPIDEVPVVRGGSAAPEEEFENFTFSYPNPAKGTANITFQVHLPFRGKIKLKLYTMSGETVFTRDLGEFPPSFMGGPAQYVWSKVNQAGSKVARGMYFAVIRLEDSEGGANVLQTVKKVLIQ